VKLFWPQAYTLPSVMWHIFFDQKKMRVSFLIWFLKSNRYIFKYEFSVSKSRKSKSENDSQSLSGPGDPVNLELNLSPDFKRKYDEWQKMKQGVNFNNIYGFSIWNCISQLFCAYSLHFFVERIFAKKLVSKMLVKLT